MVPLAHSAQETAQPIIKRNTVYFEVFGQGLYDAFSFDRLYRVDKKVKSSFSAGLTIIPSGELLVLATPISYNYIFGSKNHHLELGLGFTPMYLRMGNIQAAHYYYDAAGNLLVHEYIGHRTEIYTYFTPKIGYRFQKAEGGFFMRVTLTPPVAGINKIGSTKGELYDQGWGDSYEYFRNAAFFPYRAFPWAGVSFGYTLKK